MIPNYRKYFEQVTSPQRSMSLSKASIVASAGLYSSHWLSVPDAGGIPTTSAACTTATTGHISTFDTSVTAGKKLHVLAGGTSSSSARMSYILCDRLVHSGGLDATVTTVQSTNLPSAALPRYTGGRGVYAALEIYTAVGTTATTAIANYTSSAGVAGRVSYPCNFGGTGYVNVGRFIQLPLMPGDVGVLTVHNVQLAASTVSAAGNFGVTLYKPLMTFHGGDSRFTIGYDSFLSSGAQCAQITPDACLFWLVLAGGTTGITEITFCYGED